MSQTDTTSTFLFTDIRRAGGELLLLLFLRNYIGDYLKDMHFNRDKFYSAQQVTAC